MGLWDSIKNLALKAKCGIGIHGGAYSTPEGHPKCFRQKLCPDCLETITDYRHEYPHDWSSAPFQTYGKCIRVQRCIHCDAEQKKEVHERFNELSKDSSCRIIEQCTRCGHEQKSHKEKHSYYKTGAKTEDGKFVFECHDCKNTKTGYMSL